MMSKSPSCAHIENCCYFCGLKSGDYETQCPPPGCTPQCQPSARIKQHHQTVKLLHNFGFSPSCLACQAFSYFLVNVKNFGIEVARKQVITYCELSFLLRSTCQRFAESTLIPLLTNATAVITPKLICVEIFDLCEASAMAKLHDSENNLQIPPSRTSILQCGDGYAVGYF